MLKRFEAARLVLAVVLAAAPTVADVVLGRPWWSGVLPETGGPLRPLDLAVGAGALVPLVLLAVVLRRRRVVVRVVAGVLLAVAAAGVLASLTSRPGGDHLPARLAALLPSEASRAVLAERMGLDPAPLVLPGISPLWYSAAFTLSAVLLLVRLRPPRRRPAPLPVRWGPSLVAWGLALVMIAFSAATIWFGTSEYSTSVIQNPGVCAGLWLYFDLLYVVFVLQQVPGLVVAAVAFAGWALLARKGYVRWGRALGWVAAGHVAADAVFALGLAGMDVALAPGCETQWAGFLDGPSAVWRGYELLTAALIVFAVRVRRPGPVHRGAISRAVAALAVVTLLAGLLEAGGVRGEITLETAETCEPGRTTDAERESAFVCEVRRSYGSGLAERYAHTPDQNLVTIGRRLCEQRMRGQDAPAGADERHWGLAELLPVLCGDVERREAEEEERQRQENERFIAAAKRRCAALPRHRPRIFTVTAGRGTLWSEAGVLEVYEGDEGPDGDRFPAMEHAYTNGLVGSAPDNLAVLTADEAMHVCVTAESYRTRPPVELKGWERVVEVGYHSKRGWLVFTDGIERMPVLTPAGPGHYRVRVHMRGAERPRSGEGAGQEFLVIVYPGKDQRTRVLK
ncbi:hypothetical protein HII36_22835 [Nonomuraea sp. NN258]|uniref:hypothetical protein n=1 Tax=Nonomuraea antri TaxID=2730852 RepID=UPI00156A60D5|nr:hypothetical protein [Nonomuraea antri]NRQ34650.1 hypothetical protein [Nonomuraea antri]